VCYWGASAQTMLSGMRQRAPAMADRSWHPYAMRSFEDYEKRQRSTDQKLAKLLLPLTPPLSPPPPLPPTPPELGPAFKTQRGACRGAVDGRSWTSPR
jgi:hypothetical protein